MPKKSLKEQDVRDILQLLVKGDKTMVEVAEQFGVHRMTIMDIKAGRTWGNLDVVRPKVKKFLTDDQVMNIVTDINENPEVTYEQLADAYGVSLSTITAIRHGNTRKHLDLDFKPRRETIEPELRAKMFDMIKDGVSSPVIVKELGISRSTVERAKRKARNGS